MRTNFKEYTWKRLTLHRINKGRDGYYRTWRLFFSDRQGQVILNAAVQQTPRSTIITLPRPWRVARDAIRVTRRTLARRLHRHPGDKRPTKKP